MLNLQLVVCHQRGAVSVLAYVGNTLSIDQISHKVAPNLMESLVQVQQDTCAHTENMGSPCAISIRPQP
jgi:hypothetical protein